MDTVPTRSDSGKGEPERRVIELPEGATFPELCQAAVELARVGGSAWPLELCKAVDRIEKRDGYGASGPIVDELRRRLDSFDPPTEGEAIEWLRSR